MMKNRSYWLEQWGGGAWVLDIASWWAEHWLWASGRSSSALVCLNWLGAGCMGILISTMDTLVRDSLEAFNKQSCLLSDVNMPLGKTSPSTTQRSPVASCLCSWMSWDAVKVWKVKYSRHRALLSFGQIQEWGIWTKFKILRGKNIPTCWVLQRFGGFQQQVLFSLIRGLKETLHFD